ncbi:DUF3313 domain-containing protein [Ferrimonas aestuarii]|uniref:DUF3313 domain-containing protein n=1 Tax=Ferrimonas aestuarii TaxID=2569539 RepID=A0A4V5NW01_9GAMM|nr:DUF3313 domain-containing protein [Ferrimonas aestuarii]TKB53984.1 DUF3313 domain-containing protein [Ferrimonas aestuarii]
MKRVLVVLAAMMLSACSSTAVVDEKPVMFESFDDFRPGPDGGVDRVWANERYKTRKQFDDELSQYNDVRLDRVWVVVDESNPLSDDQVEALTHYLTDALEQRMADHVKAHPQKQASDPKKTLSLSLAITNIETPNPILAVTSSVLPFGYGISNLAKVTTGEYTNVGSATIELLARDGDSGEALFAAIDHRQGDKDFGEIIDSVDDIKDAIDWWVDRIVISIFSKIE